LKYYSFTYDGFPQSAGNAVLTKIPSYVYNMPLVTSQPSDALKGDYNGTMANSSSVTLTILEPLNGINGVPILIANACFESGTLNKGKRLH
jgi:hypothetical protein